MPSIALPVSLRGQLLSGSRFSPLSLFTTSEPGFWYDPSDLTTMFQDTAGTTPVTTPGQTVARINDKSGRGNNATQATAASRPTYGIVPLGGRRNIYTFTEQFNNVFWTKNGSTVTADGADWRLIPTATISTHGISGSVASNAGVVHTLSLEVQTGYTQWARLAFLNVADRVDAWFDLTNATKGSFTTSASMTYVNHTITDLGNGWRRITLSAIPVNAGGTTVSWLMRLAQADLDIAPWLADGTSFNRIGRPQLELGSTATAYQRVETAFDVTEAGVQSLSYLSFDGVDDFLVTPTITPNTDKVQVFAGVRKLSDAARGTIVEHSATIASNNGSFHLTAPNAASATFGFESKGTTLTDAVATFAAPTTRVVTGVGDIAGDSTIIRANGTQQEQDTADQGTGNYLAYPIYIGRRGGTTLPFSGQIYNLIVRFGANLDAGAIYSTETFVNEKTGAY